VKGEGRVIGGKSKRVRGRGNEMVGGGMWGYGLLARRGGGGGKAEGGSEKGRCVMGGNTDPRRHIPNNLLGECVQKSRSNRRIQSHLRKTRGLSQSNSEGSANHQ